MGDRGRDRDADQGRDRDADRGRDRDADQGRDKPSPYYTVPTNACSRHTHVPAPVGIPTPAPTHLSWASVMWF